jgi:hypothetical protein
MRLYCKNIPNYSYMLKAAFILELQLARAGEARGHTMLK